VATRSGQQPLIAQAVDSRNHAIVAAGVITGLVATLLRFPLLDTLVGLAVAALILRSGIELALETVRALRGEEMEFSRYELGFVEEYRRFQERQLLRELGWGKGAGLEKQVVGALETLVGRGLVTARDVLQVTEKGRAELSPEVWGVEEVEFYARAMEPRTRYVHAPLARRIVQSLPSLPENPLIVDVGTGPGFLCIELAKLLLGAAFIGVDSSPHAVETARQCATRAGLERFEARRGRAEQFPVNSDIVDLVVSRESLHEWEDSQAGCSEMCRVLKCGGYLALEDLNRACARWKRTLFVLLTGLGTDLEITRERLRAYETAFTPEEVEELLKHSGFEIIRSETGLSLFVLAAKKKNSL
jgi:ubiquinone/menaquinone biosynthesis C-methylase UbiE